MPVPAGRVFLTDVAGAVCRCCWRRQKIDDSRATALACFSISFSSRSISAGVWLGKTLDDDDDDDRAPPRAFWVVEDQAWWDIESNTNIYFSIYLEDEAPRRRVRAPFFPQRDPK